MKMPNDDWQGFLFFLFVMLLVWLCAIPALILHYWFGLY